MILWDKVPKNIMLLHNTDDIMITPVIGKDWILDVKMPYVKYVIGWKINSLKI